MSKVLVDKRIFAFAEFAVDDCEPSTDAERAAWTDEIASALQVAFENAVEEIRNSKTEVK